MSIMIFLSGLEDWHHHRGALEILYLIHSTSVERDSTIHRYYILWVVPTKANYKFSEYVVDR